MGTPPLVRELAMALALLVKAVEDDDADALVDALEASDAALARAEAADLQLGLFDLARGIDP